MKNQGFISSVSVIYPSFGFTWALSLRFPTPTPPTPFSLANSYLPSLHSYFPPFSLLITLIKWPYPTQIFPFGKQNKLIRPKTFRPPYQNLLTNLRVRPRTACSHLRRLVRNTTGNSSKFIRPNTWALMAGGPECTRWLYSILREGGKTPNAKIEFHTKAVPLEERRPYFTLSLP